MITKSFNFNLLYLFLLLLISACDTRSPKSSTEQPDYNPSISAFTSGLISNQSTIQVRLSNDLKEEYDANETIENDVFEFSPKLEGVVTWLDSRTLEFKPSSSLPSGTEFKVKLKLSKLNHSKEKDFEFSFNTIPLNISLDIEGLKSYSSTNLIWNSIKGKLYVSDMVKIEELEDIVIAEQNNRFLNISWDHISDKEHAFTIDSVERKESKEVVEILWDGKNLGMDFKGSREYSIPALGDFIFMEHSIVQQPEQYISLIFSDPISSSQYLPGLISLSNNTNLDFTVIDNEIKVYPNIRQYGTLELRIEAGIKNVLGFKNNTSKSISLNFEELKPEVRLIGNGVILPDSERLLFPFEAVNLKAVDVKIIKIFEDNIAQFLQVNSLSGSSQLKRAGRLILKKTVDLIPERAINFGEWNAFSLDLSKLIKAEPGAIYRVELSIRKKHSLFHCPDDNADNLQDSRNDFDGINERDLAYWDATNSYYDYEYENNYYNWNERDNPCTDSYFNYYNRKVARNILASNLGIISKKGQDKSMLFAVTDLRTTETLSGVKLELYNYQQQLLASLTTNNEGIAEIKLEDQPYLLIAKKDDQRGYLNLGSNNTVSLSQFDVGGAFSRKGIKGYIYGERGVWRPGDSIFVHFILEDKLKSLPEDHPVSFELRDPLGKLKKKVTLTKSFHSFYHFTTITRPDDPTGNWNLKVSVGGVHFYKNLRVETVKPNRLKIKLDFGKEKLGSEDKRLKGKLEIKWLHGSVAKNLKSVVEVNFRAMNTRFEKYPEYSFSDRTKNFSSRDRVIFDSRVNSMGEAEINTSIDMKNRSQGMLRAIFTTRAFEEGGNFSINQFSIPYSPYEVYTGIKKPEGDRYGMLITDTLQTFKIVSLDEKGQPVKRNNISVKVLKLNWRWWWHSSNENLASYTGNPEKYQVFSDIISTNSEGEGEFKMRIEYPEWGRYLVLVKDETGGHSATQTVYFDWPGYAGRSNRKDPQSANILPFSSDKTKYKVGETATLTIPTSGEGRVFLSIENGTKVFDHYWIKASGEETSFSFTITEEMTPNVYANVSLIQPHSQTANDLPIRMYGVIPILVEDPLTRITPVLTMPDILEPESTIKLEIKEKDGREMTYTVAIVDEGLLDLTGYKTPDPWQEFYAREALGVSTYDMYDFVLGAFGGRIDGVFSIGGGMDEESAEPRKSANRFPPMVRVIGPFHLEKGKRNSHKIKIPNYIGSVRTMIVAGQNGAYGNTEKTTAVRKPLMVLSTLPRVLGPGEEVALPVTVFAMEETVKKVQVQVETGDLVEIQSPKQEILFDSPGDQTITFRLKIKEKTGVAQIKVNVKSGNESAYHNTEIIVRSPNPEVTQYQYGSIEPGETWEKEISLPGMEGTNTGIIEVFSIPPFDFGRRLKSLLRYPHGCVEQTTSAAFPQLYLTDVVEANEKMKQMTEANVKSAIKSLKSFQLSSGGFGYWPNSTLENDWSTCYAGHFLLEAKEKGYEIPRGMINDWIKYQKKSSRKWSNTKFESNWHKRSLEMTQAYRLYTLALAGEPDLASMNRLREIPELNNMAGWHLTGAYVHAGQKEAAMELVKKLELSWNQYTTPNLYTFGSGLRDRAICLEILTLLDEKAKAVPLVEYIAEQLSSESWYSTQTTAYGLMAMSKYLGVSNTGKEIRYDYAWNNEKEEHAATKHPASVMERDFKDAKTSKIKITNKGNSSLFCRLSLSGVPLAGEEKEFSNNLGMSVSYKSMDGASINVSKLEQGTDFIALVRVSNPGILGYYRDMAISQIFPSGWEIQNMRMFETGIGNYSQASYEDIRDDRIYRYFNLGRRESQTFAVKLTATYEGKFYLPGVGCEAMYRKDISALIPGRWVEVVKPGE